MIITLKNLQQQTFTIEFDSGKTVLQLKEKIYNDRGSEYDVEKQKLIYAGVILDDERTIASYSVDEKKFVVVMLKREIRSYVQKPDEGGASTSAAQAASTPTTALEEEESFAQDTNVQGKAGHKTGTNEDTKSVGSGGSIDGAVLGPVGSNTSILSTASGISFLSGGSVGSGGSENSHSTFSSGDLAGVFSNTSLQSRAESNLLMGEEYSRSVESMIEMGYSREIVEHAMAASFNNPERAVEYLISGIPETQDNFNEAAAAPGCDLQQSRNAETRNEEVSASADRGGPRVESGHHGRGEGSSHRPREIEAHLHIRDGEINLPLGDGENRNEQRLADSTAANRNGGGPDREDPFMFLRDQPQFLHMRSLVYQNPDLLHAVLQQIGRTNPALLQMISTNQDAFLGMLNQPNEPMQGQINPQYPRRMTPGRRAQLAARASAGGDGVHVGLLNAALAAIASLVNQRPGESGDAGADTIPRDMLPQRPDRAAERRAAAVTAFIRERAAAAAAVSELTAATSTTVDRNAGDGDGNDSTCTSANEHLADLDSPERAGGESAITIRITPQDKEAIQRLTALGFPETLVMQAYFACEKDEQLAANFLINSAFDE